MPVVFLLIPDTALRDAVVEQIAAAKIAEARVFESAQSLLKQIENEKPALVLIDANDGDKKLAALLQAFGQEADRPVVLMLGGADDTDEVSETFAKPFRLGHLIARLRYYLETAPLLRDRAVDFGPYRLEPQNRRIVISEGEPIRLTEKETALLVFLAQCATPATRQDILAAVWGYDERIDTHTLETHIYQLRRKLDRSDENWLVNEAGAYRLARGQA